MLEFSIPKTCTHWPLFLGHWFNYLLASFSESTTAAANQCLEASRHDEDKLLKLSKSVWMDGEDRRFTSR